MLLENLMLRSGRRANRTAQLEQRHTGSPSVTVALFVAMLVYGPGSSGAQEKDPMQVYGAVSRVTQQENLGMELYLQNCAPCHGLAAKGMGPVGAMLKRPPRDLTQLAKYNKGEFPFVTVLRVIDGREMRSRVHGTSDMPVWGDVFKAESSGSEPIAAGKVLLLTKYLQSIQEQ